MTSIQKKVNIRYKAKRCLALVLSAAMTLPFLPHSEFTHNEISEVKAAETQKDTVYGDVNSDGKITILDMIALKSYLTEKNTKGFSVKAADLDEDGEVSAKDAVELSMYLLNSIGSFSNELNTDTDGDGLSDYVEKEILKTDHTMKDTDGDGLDDYSEVYLCGTDPLETDTGNTGIKDSLKDADEDKLTNAEEIKLGTSPSLTDTDEDGINDYDEVKKYKTDPLNADTDNDGISDLGEVKLGLNPVNEKSDGETIDSERIFDQKVSDDNNELALFNDRDNIYKLSVSAKVSGFIDEALSVGVSGYSAYLSNESIEGDIVDIKYDEELRLESMRVTFEIPDNTEDYFIFRYFEDLNMLLPVETECVDDQIYTETEETGTFCLVNVDKWMSGLSVTTESAFSGDVYKAVNKQEMLEVYFLFYVNSSSIESSRKAVATATKKIIEHCQKYNRDLKMYYASYTGDVKQANEKKYIDQNSSDADIEAILKSAIVSPGAVDITDFSFSLTRTLKKELLGFSAENEGSQKFCFIVDVNCQPSSASKIAVVDEMKENGVNFSIICNMLNDNGSDYEALCSDGRYSVWNPDYSYTITSKVLDQKNDVISYDYYTGVLNGITLASEITTDWYDAATGKLQPYEIRELELPDTDNDGLYDFDEIVWDDIQISNGTVQLPTLDDLCSKNKIAAKGMMDFTVLAKARGFNVDASNTKVLVLKSNPLQEDSDGDGYSDIEDPDRVRQPDYLEKYDFLDQEIFSVSFEHSIKNLENSNKAATAGNANKNDVQKFKFEWRDKENGYTISALSDSANVLTVSGITESDGTLGFTNYQGNKEQLWEVLPFYREGYEYSSEYRYGLIIRSKAMTLGGAPLYLRCIDDAVSVSNERNYSCRIFLKPVSDWKWFGDMYMRFEGWLSNNEEYKALKNTLKNYQDNIIVATGSNGFLQNATNKQDNVLTVSQYNTDVLAGQNYGVFPNVKFAEVSMNHVACEIIATYNALKMKGVITNDNDFKYFFKLALEFEKNDIIKMHLPFKVVVYGQDLSKTGALGSEPNRIYKCLDAYCVDYIRYSSEVFNETVSANQMDNDISAGDIVIVSQNQSTLYLGIHTFSGYKDLNGNMHFINRTSEKANAEQQNLKNQLLSVSSATNNRSNKLLFRVGYILK